MKVFDELKKRTKGLKPRGNTKQIKVICMAGKMVKVKEHTSEDAFEAYLASK